MHIFIRNFRLGILVFLSRYPVFPRKCPFRETRLIFHLHSIRNFRIFWVNWSTVVVNGTRQIPNGNFHGDALVPFPRLFPIDPSQKAWNYFRTGTHICHSEIPFGNFRLSFKKSRALSIWLKISKIPVRS